ncbi:MAG TPA: hypothetical protein VH880_13715 [Anaeromyxobacteraceae bacterium]|jgi:hypothetical protein
MTTITATPRAGSVPRSVGAVLLGFVSIFALSLGIDQVLHLLHVYPPWGEPMRSPGLNLLALAYRIPIAVLGSYLTARAAPRNPTRHAMILGVLGLLLSALGAVAAIKADLGPAWYPVLLALSSVPCAWLGAKLHERVAAR